MIDSKSELIKDIQRLTRNVERRATAIESREDLPQFGAESFRKFEKRVANKLDGKSLSSLSEKDLTTIHRDIRYLNDLKSLNIHGAEKARDVWLPIKEKLAILSPAQREKFWEIYSKLVGENAMLDQFKYEIQDVAIDKVFEAEDVDKTVFDILKAYDESIPGYEEYSKMPDYSDTDLSFDDIRKLENKRRRESEKQTAVLFTSKLKELHK